MADFRAFRKDPKFENLLRPLTEDEFNQLRENILETGEVHTPLVVWNGTLIDGYHRLKVIEEFPDIKWSYIEVQCPDEWAAIDIAYNYQTGRRNLTKEETAYYIGKKYEARKKSVGAPMANANARKQLPQNGAIDSEPKDYGTAAAIGRELGIGKNTVNRAEKFAQGVDALREISPEAADKVLSGKANVTKKDVAEIAKMDEDAQKEAARRIEQGEPIKDAQEQPEGKSGNSRKWTEEEKANRALTREIIAKTHSDDVPEYTMDMLVEDLKLDADNYFSALEWRLGTHPRFISENAQYFAKLIDDYIINGINEIRRRIA